MSKHLDWPEDDRICKYPDTADGSACPGCCNVINPRMYAGTYWSCIYKVNHSGNHFDIWCCEWDNTDAIIKWPKYPGRCYYCGDHVPYDGMTYCGKACSALDA